MSIPPGKHPLRFQWINGHTFAKSDVQRPASDAIPVANPDGWETARSYEVADSLRVDFECRGGIRYFKDCVLIESVAKTCFKHEHLLPDW